MTENAVDPYSPWPHKGAVPADVLRPESMDARPAPPRFSIVVPAYNEAKFLATTLDSLRQQDFPGDFEVIVVDNNSTDGTAEVAEAFGARTLHEEERGVCWARQRGTEAARGDIVVSTDADTVHPDSWLSDIDRSFRADDGCVAVAGACRFTSGPVWARVYPTLLFGLVHLIFRVTGRVMYATATNIAFRRKAWTGYDTALTQGGDELGLLRQLRPKGRITFDRRNVVTTSARRLKEGLVYNLLVTFIFYYLIGYVVNTVARRTVLGNAPAFRDEARRRRHFAFSIGVPLAAIGLLIWAV